MSQVVFDIDIRAEIWQDVNERRGKVAFLNDKILEGGHVLLRHVTPNDAEAILAAWHSEPADMSRARTRWNEARVLFARGLLFAASRLHPYASAKFCGPQISSTWRHHRPMTLRDEREKLRRFEADEDRYQYLITSKKTSDIVGCIGFKTNRSQKDGLTENCLENLRVARLGMLLFREDPWDHSCEREAIVLMLDTIFRQEFTRRDGTAFRIIEVVVPVNMEDEVTLGVLTSLGFRHSSKSFRYHGRTTRILEYVPKNLDPSRC